jgi:hypothetical protein
VNTNTIPFGIDILVVAGFSLVIYFWAMATRLPTEEQQNLFMRQAGEPVDPAPHG